MVVQAKLKLTAKQEAFCVRLKCRARYALTKAEQAEFVKMAVAARAEGEMRRSK